jgi:ATP-dependent RNA helicase DeaD
MRGIDELGFTELFPIQAEAIPSLLEGRDVIGQAQTGTGKTAAFGVPMIERLDANVNRVQGLVLAPTRELAVQVADHMSKYAKYAGFRVLAVYGGASIERQVWSLQRGIHIVVGTPGRIIDLMKRGVLNLSYVKILVLDEADRMLDMGFIDDIDYILRRVPTTRQTSLFSATIDGNVRRVCNRYMRNPQEILVSKDEIALEQIDQYYVVVNPANKFETLCNILKEKHVERAIIFCRTRTDTSKIADGLSRRGYDADALHAGFTQSQRDAVTNAFRQGRLQLLVATDVAARGLDIQGITHIINYDVPNEAPTYFHRIGRTARMGGEGTAITLVGYGELTDLENIRALTKTTMEELDETRLCGPVV